MGLLRGMARTAVVAGTATAVSNRVSRRQAERWSQEDAAQYQQPQYQQPQYQAPPPPAPAPAPAAAGGDLTSELQRLADLKAQGVLTDEEFTFPPALWARVVGDFAIAHHERRLPADHLLRSLTPLYLGRVAAFHVEIRGWPPSRVPEALERVAKSLR